MATKLSSTLKAFINAPHALPKTTPAPAQIASVYEKIANDAISKHIGLPAWLSASTAVTMTMNSPESLLKLYGLATSPKYGSGEVYTAELMREIGLKCIGFNGVPRTINSLGAFYQGLPENIQAELRKRQPRRKLSKNNIEAAIARGNGLWESIYNPLSEKLVNVLAQSHPDLPVHIIESEYGCLFSDPPSPESPDQPSVGRVLTSVVAVACLRSQTGVGPQVVSHVFGLRKAFTDGTAEAAGEVEVEGGKWLASDEGNIWLLEQIDAIVASFGKSTFAQGFGEAAKAKL